jgi:hypothetical protein
VRWMIRSILARIHATVGPSPAPDPAPANASSSGLGLPRRQGDATEPIFTVGESRLTCDQRADSLYDRPRDAPGAEEAPRRTARLGRASELTPESGAKSGRTRDAPTLACGRMRAPWGIPNRLVLAVHPALL